MRTPRLALGAGLALTTILAACGSPTPATSMPQSPQTTTGSSWREVSGDAVAPGAPAQSGAAPAAVPSSPDKVTGNTVPVAKDKPATLALGDPGVNVERNVHAGFTVGAGTFMDAFRGVVQRGSEMGGYVASTSTSPNGAGNIVAGTIVVRVPTAKLSEFITGVPSDFQPSFVDFTTVDHTADVVDAGARLQQAQSHLNALKALMNPTLSAAELNQLQQQIIDAQRNVDTLRDAQTAIQDKVKLSTATIDLTERGAKVAATVPPSPIVSAAHTGLDNDLAALSVAIGIALTALPYLLLTGVAYISRRIWLRPFIRLRTPHSTASTGPTPGQALVQPPITM